MGEEQGEYEERLRKKVKELLKEIDAVNEAETEVYGDDRIWKRWVVKVDGDDEKLEKKDRGTDEEGEREARREEAVEGG